MPEWATSLSISSSTNLIMRLGEKHLASFPGWYLFPSYLHLYDKHCEAICNVDGSYQSCTFHLGQRRGLMRLPSAPLRQRRCRRGISCSKPFWWPTLIRRILLFACCFQWAGNRILQEVYLNNLLIFGIVVPQGKCVNKPLLFWLWGTIGLCSDQDLGVNF